MDKLLEEIYTMDKATMEECAKHVMLGGGTRGMPIILRGKGVRVSDVNGKSYIDCTSQSWALYLDYAYDDLNSFDCEHLPGMSHVHQGFDTPMRYLSPATIPSERRIACLMICPSINLVCLEQDTIHNKPK